jgi:hypothetical protein
VIWHSQKSLEMLEGQLVFRYRQSGQYDKIYDNQNDDRVTNTILGFMRKSEDHMPTKFMMAMLMDAFLHACVHLHGMVLITGIILYFLSGLLSTSTLRISVAIMVGETTERVPDN